MTNEFYFRRRGFRGHIRTCNEQAKGRDPFQAHGPISQRGEKNLLDRI